MCIHQIHQASTANELQRSKLERYFYVVLDAFEIAQEKAGSIIVDYQMGGFDVRLCFAGAALIPKLTPAFEHLAVKWDPKSSITIHLWDSESTKISFPEPPWEIGELKYRGEMWMADTDRYKLLYQPGEGYLHFLDLMRKEAIFWAAKSSKIPYYETGAPLKFLINWWMGLQGYQLTHAGAIGMNDVGVLLVGKGGSGKSTTALVCLASGFDYVSDDYCLVGTDPAPHAYSLYCSGKVNAEDLHRFKSFLPALSNEHNLSREKALFFFNKLFPKQLIHGFPLKAILIPTVTECVDPLITQISPCESYLAIAPSTIFQLRGIKQPIHTQIGELVRKLPSYKLELGKDPSTIPAVLQQFLSDN